MIDKIFKAKCRNLLEQYEDVLKYLVEEEQNAQAKNMTLGNSEFEIMKNVIMDKGIVEGMKKMLAQLYKHAKE